MRKLAAKIKRFFLPPAGTPLVLRLLPFIFFRRANAISYHW